MTFRLFFTVISISLSFASTANDTTPPDPSTALWYEQPAKSWAHDALPIGNGRLGAMVFGRVGHERIALNEETVWAGARVNWNRADANKNLPKIRELLLQGKNDEAEALVNQTFTCTGGGSRSGNWGCYQELGNLDIVLHSDIQSLPLNNWKYTMITTPGIKDHRKQWQEVQKRVAEAVKVEFDDSTWEDYVIADGKPAKGYRKFQNGDRAVLRHRLTLTEKQISELGMLRMGNAARNGSVYVNGQKVGQLAGWKSSGHEKFSSNVSKHLKVGENIIAVYCTQYRRRGHRNPSPWWVWPNPVSATTTLMP